MRRVRALGYEVLSHEHPVEITPLTSLPVGLSYTSIPLSFKLCLEDETRSRFASVGETETAEAVASAPDRNRAIQSRPVEDDSATRRAVPARKQGPAPEYVPVNPARQKVASCETKVNVSDEIAPNAGQSTSSHLSRPSLSSGSSSSYWTSPPDLSTCESRCQAGQSCVEEGTSSDSNTSSEEAKSVCSLHSALIAYDELDVITVPIEERSIFEDRRATSQTGLQESENFQDDWQQVDTQYRFKRRRVTCLPNARRSLWTSLCGDVPELRK